MGPVASIRQLPLKVPPAPGINAQFLKPNLRFLLAAAVSLASVEEIRKFQARASADGAACGGVATTKADVLYVLGNR